MKQNQQGEASSHKLSHTESQALIKFGHKYLEGINLDKFNAKVLKISNVDVDVSGIKLADNAATFIRELPKSITSLDLSRCGITLEHLGEAFKAIAENLTVITHLDMSVNSLMDDTRDLPDLYFHPLPSSTRELTIFNNYMGNNAFQMLKTILPPLCYLTTLDISDLGNKANTLEIQKLVSKMPRLVYLDFNSNELNEECLKIIENFLSTLPFLNYLDIRECFHSLPDTELDITNTVKVYDEHNGHVASHNDSLIFGLFCFNNTLNFNLPKELKCEIIGNNSEHIIEFLHDPL